MVAVEREPVLPSELERPSIQKLDEALARRKVHKAKLTLPDGEVLILPDSVSRLLARMVHDLARGNAVTVIPIEAELTTQQAAELLNVSRPFLVKLLESCKIPFHMVGTHRRVLSRDLVAYMRRRRQERQQALNDLARESQELGLYE